MKYSRKHSYIMVRIKQEFANEFGLKTKASGLGPTVVVGIFHWQSMRRSNSFITWLIRLLQ